MNCPCGAEPDTNGAIAWCENGHVWIPHDENAHIEIVKRGPESGADLPQRAAKGGDAK